MYFLFYLYNNKFLNPLYLIHKKVYYLIPFYCKIIYGNKITLVIKFLFHESPFFIIKILTITLCYFVLLYILFATTLYESIIIIYINLFKYLKKFFLNSKKFSYFILTISITSQFLERIIYNYSILHFLIKIKYNQKKNFFYFLIYI